MYVCYKLMISYLMHSYIFLGSILASVVLFTLGYDLAQFRFFNVL